MNWDAKTALMGLLLVCTTFPASGEEPLAHWVSAERAGIDGRLARSAFGPDALFEMERWLLKEKPPRSGTDEVITGPYASCDHISSWSYRRELVPPDKVLAEASYAAVGSVSSLEPGLYRGNLATLVTVSVDRWLLFPGSSPPSTVAFLAEETQVVINDIRYCRKGFRDDLLVAGRRVFLAASDVLRIEPLALFAFDNHVFYETSKSAVSLGAPGNPTWAKSWSQFEADL